jgi:hypothetical protein
MVSETENGHSEEGSAIEPSFYEQKSARQVMGRIISTNFAVMAAGLNGQ